MTSPPPFVTSFDEQFSTDLSQWVVLSAANGSSNGYPGGPAQFGTDEIETVGDWPENLSVTGGQLRITPTRQPDGSWHSARIETQRVFKPAVGSVMRVEASIALPDVHGTAARGYWPAFWMMGSSQRDNRWIWPACGEIDITESVNAVNKNWSTLHGGPASLWGGPFNEPDGYSNGGVAPTTGDVWGGFHTYRMEWDRTGVSPAPVDTIRWYLDGVQVHSAQPATISAGDWANMSGHPGYFIILNCAMGGQFPAKLGGGPDSGTTSGAPLIVDYVRVSYSGSEAAETADGNDGLGGAPPPPPDDGGPPGTGGGLVFNVNITAGQITQAFIVFNAHGSGYADGQVVSLNGSGGTGAKVRIYTTPEDGWKAVLLGALAQVDPDTAWTMTNALTGWDDGSSKTQALYHIATQT